MARTTSIVWRVAAVPTGRWRSFERRGWPTAHYGKDGPPLAFVYCADDYYPALVRAGTHAPLELVLCHHQHPDRGASWKRFKLKRTAATLAEAKEVVAAWYAEHPDWLPEEGA